MIPVEGRIMQPNYVERARAIGGPVADAFANEALTVRGEHSEPHPISLDAILAMVKSKPELNDAALVQCLLAWASKYADQRKAREFRAALNSAVQWCSPQSLKAIPEFNPGSAMRHRVNRQLPDLRETLVLLADLAGAALYPVSAEALRNCIRLMHEYGLSNLNAVYNARYFSAFQRACSGAEMVWA
jgi:hypothetical protein